nr:MAG TPA: hypothetical protein [Crassvirales sp.]DAK96751.1 MAG TPA: hypothetical protein [Bacteriophage sp.]DAT29182.1 MAG TPA: hypothetical protein [Caudoviricetes sp.]
MTILILYCLLSTLHQHSCWVFTTLLWSSSLWCWSSSTFLKLLNKLHVFKFNLLIN